MLDAGVFTRKSTISNARLIALEEANAINWTEYWESIASGTSGTLTIPDGHEILLNQWADGVDAVVSQIEGDVPTGALAVDSGGDPVTTTLNAAGAWAFSAAPTAYPVAIVFAARGVGGGGGGEWEVVETRAMTGNAIELFTVGDDDIIKMVLSELRYGGDTNSFPNISLSVDGGSTYPNTHDWTATEQITNTATFHGTGLANAGSIWLYDAATQRETANADILFFGIADSGALTSGRFEYTGNDSSSAGDSRGSFRFDTAGAVNKIKVFAQSGQTMTAGTITLLKRTY